MRERSAFEQSWPACPRMKNISGFVLLFPLQFQPPSLEFTAICEKRPIICIYPLLRRTRETKSVRGRICPLRTEVIPEQNLDLQVQYLDCLLLVLEKFL